MTKATIITSKTVIKWLHKGSSWTSVRFIRNLIKMNECLSAMLNKCRPKC